jgi:hypothetical protein
LSIQSISSKGREPSLSQIEKFFEEHDLSKRKLRTMLDGMVEEGKLSIERVQHPNGNIYNVYSEYK